jgi:hypothetical protein
MPTNFNFQGALHVPPDTGVAACPIPIHMAGQFVSKTDVEIPLQGSGTVDVPLGGVGPAGLKALLVKVDPTSDPAATPIIVKINGHAKGEEIAPGGFLAIGSPLPKDGVKSVSITHTSNNVVKVWALG